MNAGGIEKQVGDSGLGDSELERQASALLISSAEALSGEVRSRLTRARHAALAVRQARLRYRLQRWAPAGAVAAAALALLVVFLPHQRPTPNNPFSGSIEDIDLLTSDLPLSADQDVDYQFYEWAVDAAATPGAGAVNDSPSSGAAAHGT